MTIIPSLQNRSSSVDIQELMRRLIRCPVHPLMASALITGMAIAASGTPGLASSLSFNTRESNTPELSQETHPTLISQLPGPITLQRDDSGNAVSALQRRLAELGFYNGPISGFFGELTESAVRDFQASRGLTADGVVGASTTEALRSAPSSTLSTVSRSAGGLTIGSTGSEVRQVQTRLTELGFYSGPVTGFYGELTESAVRNFQSSNGLTVDGVVGPATLSAIQQGRQSSTSSAPDPNDGILEQGETGPAVADLQRRLSSLNYYNGPIDGDFGRLTADAVLRFQRAQGLVADGVVGPATLAAISRVESGSTGVSSRPVGNTSGAVSTASSQGAVVRQPSVTSTPPRTQTTAFPVISSNPFPSAGGTSIPSGASTASPEAVMALQRNLANQGFYNGPIDGVMSFETQQAIAAARSAYGVDSTDFDAGNPL
ncbi:MAG: peptidoglycan-binding protein [Leptolyngbyaceae bacterium]|nr:peptidoglycan-binding protein [Leptolyngbyaceae bacterium]